jgi:hypothetical protein
MNIRTNEAGCVTNEHKVDEENTYSDMGESSYTLTDYSKDDKLFLTGGFWTYYIKDKKGKTLFEGWWNSNDEFDETIRKLEAQL